MRCSKSVTSHTKLTRALILRSYLFVLSCVTKCVHLVCPWCWVYEPTASLTVNQWNHQKSINRLQFDKINPSRGTIYPQIYPKNYKKNYGTKRRYVKWGEKLFDCLRPSQNTPFRCTPVLKEDNVIHLSTNWGLEFSLSYRTKNAHPRFLFIARWWCSKTRYIGV